MSLSRRGKFLRLAGRSDINLDVASNSKSSSRCRWVILITQNDGGCNFVGCIPTTEATATAVNLGRNRGAYRRL